MENKLQQVDMLPADLGVLVTGGFLVQLGAHELRAARLRHGSQRVAGGTLELHVGHLVS